MTQLNDKTALITGGGRGIGRAIALQLAQRGSHVAVAARSKDELLETTSAIAAAGGRAHPIVADLAAPGAGTALARRALDELGRVDILINNAAVVAPLGPSTGVDLEAFARAFTVDVTSVARVVALSGDDEATTRRTIAENGLRFPVGHDADADVVAAATGAFVNDEPRYLQSTGFVLDPEGRVIVSVYSSGAIGRLVPEDVIGLVKYVREHEAQEQAA
jgi:NAD(P)-dependent dehydrogenase (short-subunit alcohol dehydrogenase family)